MLLPQLAVSCSRPHLQPELRLLYDSAHRHRLGMKFRHPRRVRVGSGMKAITVGTAMPMYGFRAPTWNPLTHMRAGFRATGPIVAAVMCGLKATGAGKSRDS